MAALPGLFSTIEHVGSTSVPGLAAKPIIDLMAATGDLDGVGAREGNLHLLGYGFTTPGCRPGFCTAAALPVPGRTICMFVQASTLPTRNQVLLGDYLRGHPDDAALKRRLVALHDNGGDYTRQRPNSSRNSPTRRGPSAGSRRRQCERSER